MSGALRSWHAVDVVVLKQAADAVESAFNVLDAIGIETDSLRKADDESLLVTGFFEVAPNLDDVAGVTKELLAAHNFSPDVLKKITHRTVEEADWLHEWKKHWQPTTVGHFVIAPPWSDVDDYEKIVIRIEPNMAFGTGTHETTCLCLKAINDNYSSGMSFLDVGTGTGILAIAVAKLADKNTAILACDTDVDSVKIARENAVLNNVGDLITFADGSITEETPSFDLVCANLTLDVISQLLSLLLKKSRRTLLLSGILVEQESLITDELRKFEITNPQIERAGEWLSVLIDVSRART